MLIEDVEALKCWLAKLLEPICDADPSALANYVVALVKKDKTDQDLRIFCADQLDVFLQKETNGFIDKLFEGLYSKDYLSVPDLKPDNKPTEQEKKEIQEELTANRLQCAPPCGLESFEEERDGRRKKLPSPQGNRSDSNDRSNEVSRRIPDANEYHMRGSPLEKSVLPNEDKSNIGVTRRNVLEDLRERPDAYNRISSERPREKKREDGKWREHDRYYERNEPYRDKYDWRRGKSKSPIKSRPLSRSRSPARGRNREQDTNRNRDQKRREEHLNADGGSRDSPTRKLPVQFNIELTEGEHRERSKFESERNELEIPYTPVSMPASKPTVQYSSSVQTITNSVTVLAPAHHSENTKESWSNYYNNHSAGNSFGRTTQLPKRRCRDYEEMGLCIRGDLCEFDHGNDPLVVDDVSLPSMIPFPPPPGLPPPGMLLPPLPAPPNMRMPVQQPHSQGPPPGVPPMPRMPITQSSMINNREPPRTAVPSLAPVGPRLPPPIPPNLLYTVSEMSCNYPLPPGMPPFPRIRGPMLPPLSKNTDDTYEPDGYNPEAPSISVSGRSQFRQFYTRSQRSNLIGLTSGDMEPNPRAANIVIQTDPPPVVKTENNSNRVVVEPDRKRPMSSLEGPPVKKSWMDKQGTNNQNKPMFNKRIQFTNTKLEVRKVPPELNNITKLNEHFSKFGTIVNIQVAFKGDPECALIQYLANEEARRAISSTEAVLNNRFIKLIWHRENDQQHPPHQPYQQTQQHHPQPSQYNQQMQRAHTPPASVNIATPVPKPQGSGSYVLNNVTAKPNLGQASGNQTDTPHLVSNQSTSTGEDCQTFSSTNHAKTVYSSMNMKTPSKQLTGAKALDAQEALKKKQEALKLQHDMKKKKQEMLEKQIECQKMLISRLEKNKTMKAEERGEIMKTLKELGVKISQLKDELKNSSTASTSSKPKSKTEAQKELLDAEMDFYKRVTSGEDATELRKKLNQLQVEAARLGLLSTGRGKTMPPQSRGRGRGRGARGRGSLNNMVVDHRPKSLAVSGFIQEEKEDLLQHFAQFGSIEDLKEDDSPLSVILMFKTRSEAENAANQGSRFRGRRLQVSWHKPRMPSICTDVEEDDPRDEESETTELILNEDDDEDEDEDESRSWRR